MTRPTFAEINLDAIAFNLRQVRKLVGPNVKICPAVKADAYGHGAVEVSRTLLDAGAEMLGVATVDEAVELREAGIQTPILVLQCTCLHEIPKIVEYDISAMTCDRSYAEELSRQALDSGKRIKVHIKVDTGMGRVGVQARETVDFALALSKMPGLEIEGIFTHFPSADEEDLTFTRRQVDEFSEVTRAVDKAGVQIRIRHAANSAAILNVPKSYFDMVRPGIMIYGSYDSEFVSREIELRQSMTLKTRAVFLKVLLPGRSIGYGRTFTTARRTVVATVPVGYADGYNRLLSNRAAALIRGVRVPVIGRICMDQTMLDVTGVSGVTLGDEVVLYGSQGNERISIEEIAGLQGTISNEVICAVGKRVPRVYVPRNS